MESKRVTLRDVAKEAGASLAAVSMALNHRPGISTKRAAEIRHLAEAIGYKPDPMLSALANYRNRNPQAPRKASLAVLSAWPDPDFLENNIASKLMVEAARQSAIRAGYGLQTFWMGEARDGRQASQILQARGVRGLIIESLPNPIPERLDLAWDRFATVALGHFKAGVSLHQINTDRYTSALELCRHLAQRGYRRPGICLSRWADEASDYGCRAAFAIIAQQLRMQIVPPLVFEKTCSRQSLQEWIDSHGVDVVVGSPADTYPLMKACRMRLPSTIGFASESDGECFPDISGMHHSPGRIGKAAVDFLDGMIRRDERGIPLQPQTLCVSTHWNEGTTLRPQVKQVSS